MLLNVSYWSKSIRAEIERAVGKPFSILKKLKMKGSGTRRMFIKSADPKIKKLLHPGHKSPTCNLEIRPHGIIIRFKSGTETMAWIIPYAHLEIAVRSDEVTYSDGQNSVVVYNIKNDDEVEKIARKVKIYASINQSTGHF